MPKVSGSTGGGGGASALGGGGAAAATAAITVDSIANSLTPGQLYPISEILQRGDRDQAIAAIKQGVVDGRLSVEAYSGVRGDGTLKAGDVVPGSTSAYGTPIPDGFVWEGRYYHAVNLR